MTALKQLMMALVFVLAFLSACGVSRHVASPSAPPPDLGLTSSNRELSVTLNYVISPDGPGSWVKGARWDEYVLTIHNLSDHPCTVEKIQLIDPRGLYIESGANPAQLEKLSETLMKTYGDAAILGAGVLTPSVAAVPSFAVPILGPVLYQGTQLLRIKDKEKIQAEFNKRQLMAFTIEGKATITGSRFFPIVPSPKALVVNYSAHEKSKALKVSLENLSQLHVESETPAPTTPTKNEPTVTEQATEQDRITEVQRRLSALGYDPGEPDGILGPRTRAAILAYQEDQGLSTDGNISEALLENLRQNK